jgi:neutral amino acid transport system ATP-binding protein
MSADAPAPVAVTSSKLLDGLEGRPGVAKPDPILVVDGVRRAFGGLIAVDVDHVEVQRKTITALIGPNGAGKTTFFNLLTGFDEVDSGQWLFDGQRVGGMQAHKLARMGMVRTFQLTKSLARLSVIENMRLGAADQRGERLWAGPFKALWKSQEANITTRAEVLLERFRLDHMRDEFAGSLSGGQRKLLEMARALMTDPRLVMLDEPMAGVNPALKQSLLDHIKQLANEGRTVLFVEHDMDMVHEISDWVLVMAEGQLIAEGTAAQISGNQAVIDAYLGAHHDVDLGAMDDRDAMEALEVSEEEIGVDALEQVGTHTTSIADDADPSADDERSRTAEVSDGNDQR